VQDMSIDLPWLRPLGSASRPQPLSTRALAELQGLGLATTVRLVRLSSVRVPEARVAVDSSVCLLSDHSSTVGDLCNRLGRDLNGGCYDPPP
jgi:hypothetical protein